MQTKMSFGRRSAGSCCSPPAVQVRSLSIQMIALKLAAGLPYFPLPRWERNTEREKREIYLNTAQIAAQRFNDALPRGKTYLQIGFEPCARPERKPTTTGMVSWSTDAPLLFILVTV